MDQLTIEIVSEPEMRRFGQTLAASLPAGTTVCLIGTLGAGKTRLVQEVAEASGILRDRVVSPTFTLCNEYPGTPGIHHLDLYRVADEDELLELGCEEFFASPAWTFVEWGDRFADHLPADRLDIAIEVTGPSTRQLQLTAGGPAAQHTLAAIAQRWSNENSSSRRG